MTFHVGERIRINRPDAPAFHGREGVVVEIITHYVAVASEVVYRVRLDDPPEQALRTTSDAHGGVWYAGYLEPASPLPDLTDTAAIEEWLTN